MSVVRYVLVLFAFVCAVSRLASATLTDKDTILLADFTNKTGDEEFSGSLQQPLRTALEESPFLSVLPAARVAAILTEMHYSANAPLTLQTTLEVCRRMRCRASVAGSLSREGARFAIVLQVVDCKKGQFLTQVSTEAPGKDQILDALGDAVGKLRVQVGEPPESVREFRTPLSRATSASFGALKAWSTALQKQQGGADLAEGSHAALPLLEAAVTLDPNFASALFTIGLIYRDALQEARARDYLIRAFMRSDRSSVRERFRNAGMYYSFVTVEYEKAVKTYTEWIKAYPRDERPISNLGSFYGDVCRYEEAIEQFRQARKMNPSNVIYHEDLMEILTAVGRFGEAREAYQEMLRMKLDDDAPHVFLYAIAALQHDRMGKMDLYLPE
jgi:tetratricopeptide (TPR) repeat protein